MGGEFHVYLKEGNSHREIYKQIGSTGINDWREIRLNLQPTTQNYQIVFEAIRGSGYQSDIAIDDVSFTDEACRPIPPSIPPASIPSDKCHDTSDREGQYCAQWAGA